MPYLDQLRLTLTVLVFFHHSAAIYGSGGGGWYMRGETTILSERILQYFLTVNQFFFMGLFFFIAGYFSEISIAHKGLRYFLTSRFVRLGLPVILYGYLISPLTVSLASLNTATHVNFWQSIKTVVIDLRALDIGPLWFLLVLGLFTLLYCPLRPLILRVPEFQSADIRPSFLVSFAVSMAIVNFAIRIWNPIDVITWKYFFGFFGQYLPMFLLGAYAARSNALEKLSSRNAKYWFALSLIILVTIPLAASLWRVNDGDFSPFYGGLSWTSFAFSAAEGLFCVAMSYVLLVLFREKFHSPGRFSERASMFAYKAFIIHPPLLVLTAIAIKPLLLHPLVAFLLVGVVGSAATFAVAMLLWPQSSS